MPKKCNCVGSLFSPHRRVKCLVHSFGGNGGKKKSSTTATPVPDQIDPVQTPADIPIVDIDGLMCYQDNQDIDNDAIYCAEAIDPNDDDDVEELLEASNVFGIDENSRSDRECDCAMYKIQRHRRRKCKWKPIAAGAVAGAIVGGTIGAVAVAGTVGVAVACQQNRSDRIRADNQRSQPPRLGNIQDANGNILATPVLVPHVPISDANMVPASKSV